MDPTGHINTYRYTYRLIDLGSGFPIWRDAPNEVIAMNLRRKSCHDPPRAYPAKIPLSQTECLITHLRFNSSPLKSYRNPKGYDRLPVPSIFQGLLLLNFGSVRGHKSTALSLIAALWKSPVNPVGVVKIPMMFWVYKPQTRTEQHQESSKAPDLAMSQMVCDKRDF